MPEELEAAHLQPIWLRRKLCSVLFKLMSFLVSSMSNQAQFLVDIACRHLPSTLAWWPSSLSLCTLQKHISFFNTDDAHGSQTRM